MRTACKTVSEGDKNDFLSGKIARYLVSERAADFQTAWGLPVTGDIDTVTQFSGLSYADLAQAHMQAFVPICLSLESGKHTCHPENPPGRDFYDGARAQFVDQLRKGDLPWRRPSRGGSGNGAGGSGDVGPGGGETKAFAGVGLVGVALLVGLLFLKSK